MKLSADEKLVLEHLSNKKDLEVIPEDMRNKLTPEILQFTLAELQSKGLIEYMSGAYTPTKKAEELFKKRKPIIDKITAWGHPDIVATNKTKIVVTKENEPINEKGSIIGVGADKACQELKTELKDYLKFGKKVKITISVNGIEDTIIAHGSPALELTDKTNISIEKSDSIGKKTLAIFADKAACDLKKELIEKLKNPKIKMKIELEIK